MQLKSAARAGAKAKKPANEPLFEAIASDNREYISNEIAKISRHTRSRDAAAAAGRFLAQSAHPRLNSTYLGIIARQTRSGEAVIAAIKAAAQCKNDDQHVLDVLSFKGMEDYRHVVRCAGMIRRLKKEFKIKGVVKWLRSVLDYTDSGEIACEALKALVLGRYEPEDANRFAERMKFGFIRMVGRFDGKQARTRFSVSFIRCAFPAQ
jgi:hypothetical protein